MAIYASIDREAIWVAFINYLKTAPAIVAAGFKTVSRSHVAPPQLSNIQQPALFMAQRGEKNERVLRGLPEKLTLMGMAFIYVFQSAIIEAPGSETNLASTDLNGLVRAFHDAVSPDTTDRGFTIGGLAYNCWIEGYTVFVEGNTSQQAMVAVPVHIEVP